MLDLASSPTPHFLVPPSTLISTFLPSLRPPCSMPCVVHVDSHVSVNPGAEPGMYTLYTLWTTFPQNEKRIVGSQKCILKNKHVDSHIGINAGAEPAVHTLQRMWVFFPIRKLSRRKKIPENAQTIPP